MRPLYYSEEFQEGREYLCPTCNKGLVSKTTQNPDDYDYGTDSWKNPRQVELQCESCRDTFMEYELKIVVEPKPC